MRSRLGVYLSLKIDLPTGATIVCTFAIVLIAMAILRVMLRRKIPVASAEPAVLSHR